MNLLNKIGVYQRRVLAEGDIKNWMQVILLIVVSITSQVSFANPNLNPEKRLKIITAVKCMSQPTDAMALYGMIEMLNTAQRYEDQPFQRNQNTSFLMSITNEIKELECTDENVVALQMLIKEVRGFPNLLVKEKGLVQAIFHAKLLDWGEINIVKQSLLNEIAEGVVGAPGVSSCLSCAWCYTEFPDIMTELLDEIYKRRVTSYF